LQSRAVHASGLGAARCRGKRGAECARKGGNMSRWDAAIIAALGVALVVALVGNL
jgi:hypothetical protein